MKKLVSVIVVFLLLLCVLEGCILSQNNVDSEASSVGLTKSEFENGITKEMAYKGVNNYCHITYDWSIAKDNPSIMSVEMGEETDAEYQVIFKSYTGSCVYFYVDKLSGITKMVDYVPDLDIREESGTINLFDYLEN